MKVFVTGATGVLGRASVDALLSDGHEVTGLARSAEGAHRLQARGAQAAVVPIFDLDALTEALTGFDAVCNLLTHVPVGLAGLWPGAWRANDRLHSEGSKFVVDAASAAGVRVLVQESMSLMYDDGRDDWITESSPVCVTRPLEPAAVAETNAAAFGSHTRRAVVLRFGALIGDDPMTCWLLDHAWLGHPISVGEADSWVHVLHPEDAGEAVAAALGTSAGVYNVGADPVRRGEVGRVFADVAKRPTLGLVPKVLVRMAGERMEPLSRSHRVSSQRLHQATGWKPTHDFFDETWLTATSRM